MAQQFRALAAPTEDWDSIRIAHMAINKHL